VVKLFGQEDYEAERLHEQDEKIFRLFLRSSLVRQLPLTEVFGGIAVAGVFWYGGAPGMAHRPPAAGVRAFPRAVLPCYEPLKKLVRTNYTIQQGIAGAERVFALLDRTPQIVDRPDATVLQGVGDGIEFRNVSFEYDPGEPVLRDISLRIPAGKVVALVGMSG